MMDKMLIDQLRPAGTSLFFGSETFLRDLSEEDESVIIGGKRSRSGRPKRKRRPKKAGSRRRQARSRSNSRG